MSADPVSDTVPDSPPVSAVLSRTTAKYLFAVATLRTEQTRVSTGELTSYLDVSPASGTEMLSKLDDRGLLDYEKYAGVRLTSRGRSLATQLQWRCCVVTKFFDGVLDTSLDDVTTLQIAYTLPRDGITRLRDIADVPCVDSCPESDPDTGVCAV